MFWVMLMQTSKTSVPKHFGNSIEMVHTDRKRAVKLLAHLSSG